MSEISQIVDLGERHRYAMQLRHKLAMESIGLIRTCLHVQRPVFDAIINAEREAAGSSTHQEILHDASFAMQLKMVKTCVEFLNELDALADEVLERAAKEKLNG